MEESKLVFTPARTGKGENFSVYFSKEYTGMLKSIAEANDITVTRVITSIVNQYIDQYYMNNNSN